MRTSRNRTNTNPTLTQRHEKVLNMFNTFTNEDIIQCPTLNKYELNDNAIDGVVKFFETVFENEYGKITVRYYLSDEEDGTRRHRYSAIFETNDACLGIMLMPNTKDGDTVRLYDGQHYYHMPDGYLLQNDETLGVIEKFVRGIMYYGEEEFGGKNFFLK